MHKIKFFLAALTILLFLFSGCVSEQNNSQPTTLEELKENPEKFKSEFDKCMDEVDAMREEQATCTKNKLKEQGFNDGIDCIQNPNEGPCQGIERYNAEVYASNDCLEELDEKYPNRVSIFDCSKLIG